MVVPFEAQNVGDAYDGVRRDPSRRSMDGSAARIRCSLDGARPDEATLLKSHSIGFDDGYVPVTSYYAAYNPNNATMKMRTDFANTSCGDLAGLDAGASKPVKTEAVRVVRRPRADGGALKPSRSEAAAEAPQAAGAEETPVSLDTLLAQQLIKVQSGALEDDGYAPNEYYKVVSYFKADDVPGVNRQSSLLDLVAAGKTS